MERRSRDDLVFSLFRVIRLLLREKPYICRMNGKSRLFYPALLLLLVLLWAGNLAYGTVSIPLGEVIRILLGDSVEQTAWQHIVLQSRLPQAVTALLVGASLAVSGLLLQTLFRNPLAGPSILGISDGANLGMALVMLLEGGAVGLSSVFSVGGSLALIVAAFVIEIGRAHV